MVSSLHGSVYWCGWYGQYPLYLVGMVWCCLTMGMVVKIWYRMGRSFQRALRTKKLGSGVPGGLHRSSFLNDLHHTNRRREYGEPGQWGYSAVLQVHQEP